MSEMKKTCLSKCIMLSMLHHSNQIPYFRTVSWWTNASTASVFRRTLERTSSSAWSSSVSCFCGRKPFRWPRSSKWNEYRYCSLQKVAQSKLNCILLRLNGNFSGEVMSLSSWHGKQTELRSEMKLHLPDNVGRHLKNANSE